MSNFDEMQAEQASAAPIDPAQAQYLEQQLASQQNLIAGLLGGAAASAFGAAAWAGITVASEYQIGFMAIGVGFLVGFAVRFAGKGVTSVFGVVGAFFALLGCLVGNLLAVTAVAAGNEGLGLIEVLPQLTPVIALDLMIAWFTPIDLLFYAIAVYEGYRLSFRQVSAEELDRMLTGSVPGSSGTSG